MHFGAQDQVMPEELRGQGVHGAGGQGGLPGVFTNPCLL